MIKSVFKIVLFWVVFVSSNHAFAKDSTHIYSLNRSQIEDLNLSNVADLVRSIPIFYSSSDGVYSDMLIGGMTQTNISITIDGIPMLLHNNLVMSLHAISLLNINEVKIYFGNINSPIKNNSGLHIELTSIPLENKPWNLNASLGYTSLGDLQTSLAGQVSNRKHTLGVGLNRKFENGYSLTDSRENLWASSERYDLNMKYKFLVLPGLTLNLYSNTSSLKAQQKGGVIESTSRVSDRYTRILYNSTGMSLKANLSKIHKINVVANTTSYQSRLNYVDLDLSSGKQETNAAMDPLDSLKYRYNMLNANLVGVHKSFNYVIGFEYTSLDDRVNKNINAFRTLNTDYAVYGQFNYKYPKYFDITGGASFLTNSKAGNYFLSRAQITIAPDQVVQFKSSFINSLAYTEFGRIFYPTTITQTNSNNNFLIAPVRNNSFSNILTINKNNVKMNAGVVYSRFSEIAGLDADNKWQNSSSSINTMTFFGFDIANKNYTVKPVFILHSINTLADSQGLNFFYPELNLFVQGKLPAIGTLVNLNVRSLGKFPVLFEENNDVILDETNAFTMVNISVSKQFNKKLKVILGVTNLLNNSQVIRTQYQVFEFNKVNIFEGSRLVDRGRNVYFRLTYQWD